jgi:hypothetical protein
MNKYFKGWYFKAQNSERIVAFIPAMHIDENGGKSASVQIISDSGVWSAWFPFDRFSFSGGLRVKIGENEFDDKGLRLNIRTDSVEAAGKLDFGPLRPIRYDIMGPFSCVPFMECRHSVLSMTHAVRGSLSINGESYSFDNDACVGYIEGDRGRSFPKVYAWTQHNFFDQSPGSLMLSIAEIPFGPSRFTGIIGVILWRGREYRIATYLGAKAVEIGNGLLVVKQGRFRFTAQLIEKQDRLLFAPVSGGMKRMIHESPSCTAYYLFEENGNKLFEFKTGRASFEYEYDK